MWLYPHILAFIFTNFCYFGSTELNNKTEEEPVLPQGDNQNKSEVETPVAPEAETPDKIPDESNNVISNQQQIQSIQHHLLQ